MKTPALVAALVLSFAGAAFAQEATYDYAPVISVQKSRADVMAEVAAARAAGTLAVTEAEWPKQAFVATRTRADVQAEAVAAAHDAEWRELNGETNAFSIAVVPAKAPRIALAK